MKRFILLLLFFISSSVWATKFTDLKFSQYQVADSQWNVNACMNTATCQVYSKNPGVMYKYPPYGGTWAWQAGQYVQFSETGNTTYPYEAKVYNSNGTLAASIGTIRLLNMGADYFFAVGTDTWTGQLFSYTSGMANTTGVSWTGTQNASVAQADSYAINGSTTPLAAGETAGGGGAAPVYTSDITVVQSTARNAAYARRDALGRNNAIYIDQRNGSDNINIEQNSSYNSVQGLGGAQYAIINGSGNNITIRQGDPSNTTGKNLVELNVVGSSNNLNLNQGRTNTAGSIDSSESNGHIQRINIVGSYTTINSVQNNSGGSTSGHYYSVDISGNSNANNVTQTGNNSKSVFEVVNGTGNGVNISQSGLGNHYLDLTLTGFGNSITAIQTGDATHKATISLTNAGGPSAMVLTQQGNTAQVYSIQQSCATMSGCSVSVTQGQ